MTRGVHGVHEKYTRSTRSTREVHGKYKKYTRSTRSTREVHGKYKKYTRSTREVHGSTLALTPNPQGRAHHDAITESSQRFREDFIIIIIIIKKHIAFPYVFNHVFIELPKTLKTTKNY